MRDGVRMDGVPVLSIAAERGVQSRVSDHLGELIEMINAQYCLLGQCSVYRICRLGVVI